MRIIAGEARGRRIRGPRGRVTRPALDQLRESVFSILGEAVEGCAVLDLFAGAGAFGLEAVSRGAASAIFVERDRSALLALEHNIQDLGFAGRCRVVRADALRFEPRGIHDLIFVDPPFALFDDAEEPLALVRRLERLLASALGPGGTLLLRIPTGSGIELSRPAADQRTFRASTVLFFENP